MTEETEMLNVQAGQCRGGPAGMKGSFIVTVPAVLVLDVGVDGARNELVGPAASC